MSSRPLDAMVAGELFTDLIMSGFAEWPRPGTEARTSEFRREVGGGAAITACGLAKLGLRTAVLGVVGSDGDWVVRTLEGHGVGTAEVFVDGADLTAVTVAISTPEERTFLTYPGANRGFPEKLREAAGSGVLRQARHVHLGYSPELVSAAGLLDQIRGNGCSVSLDVGWNEEWLRDSRALEVLSGVDIFFPNEVEARVLTGERDSVACLRAFDAAGVKRVAMKLGPEGAALLWDGEILHSEAFAVNPVDTVGAGDCFDAGFLYFWLNGADPLTCLRAGCFCGAASTEAAGGIAGFPDLARVREALGI